MALGPQAVIPAPVSGVPVVSLLRTATVIDHPAPPNDPNVAPTGDPNPTAPDIDKRWGNGIRFSPENFGDAQVQDPCDADGLDLSSARNRPAIRDYQPFIVDAYDACSTFGWQRNDYEQRARRMMAAHESKAVAHEFWTGAEIPTNPHLADGANTAGHGAPVVVGTALDLHNGVSALVQALSDGNGGVGMIHCRPRMLSMLIAEMWLRYEAGTWITAMGNKIVADAGYPGTGPSGEAITNVGGAITEWLFATDLVEIHRGPVEVFATPLTYETTDHTQNNEMVRAQRLYAPVWNGTVLAACSITTPAVD